MPGTYTLTRLAEQMGKIDEKASAPYNNAKSILFDGVNEFLLGQDWAAFDGVNKMTWAGWIKTDTVVGNHALFNKWDFSGPLASWNIRTGVKDIMLHLATNPVTNDLSKATTNTAPIASAGVWYHYCIVYDGTQVTNTDRVKIYIDGVSQALTHSGDPHPATQVSSTAVVEIGVFTGIGEYWDGNIDEHIMFTTALTAAEVLVLYALGNPFNYFSHPTQGGNILMWLRCGDDIGDGDNADDTIFDQTMNFNFTIKNTDGDEIVSDVP